jgi:hypothetical protein
VSDSESGITLTHSHPHPPTLKHSHSHSHSHSHTPTLTYNYFSDYSEPTPSEYEAQNLSSQGTSDTYYLSLPWSQRKRIIEKLFIDVEARDSVASDSDDEAFEMLTARLGRLHDDEDDFQPTPVVCCCSTCLLLA